MFKPALLPLLLVLASPAVAADPAPAIAAAERWLALLDQGAYAQSWSQAAPLFRDAISQSEWSRRVSALRAPLGMLDSRRVESAQAVDELPGAPPGQYLVIHFRSRFRRQSSATETVTPMLIEGEWRVAGYFVR